MKRPGMIRAILGDIIGVAALFLILWGGLWVSALFG